MSHCPHHNQVIMQLRFVKWGVYLSQLKLQCLHRQNARNSYNARRISSNVKPIHDMIFECNEHYDFFSHKNLTNGEPRFEDWLVKSNYQH